MAKAKYDPRLDQLAAHFMRNEESPHGWSFRAQEAISFGHGHLRVWWGTDDLAGDITSVDLKRTARGVQVVVMEGKSKLFYFLPLPFDSIIAQLEQRVRGAEVPASLDEFTAFLGLREPKEEPCRTSTM